MRVFKLTFVALVSLVLCVSAAAQEERPRRVLVVGAKKKPQPRLITSTRQTKKTILLSRSNVVKDSQLFANYEKRVFELINRERTTRNVPVLSYDPELASIARKHSEDMAEKGYFSHIDMNGNTVDGRALEIGIDSWIAIGENIAYNQGLKKPCEFTVDRWLKSKSHRNNLLDGSWIRTGVGVAITKDGKHFFTQVFSR